MGANELFWWTSGLSLGVGLLLITLFRPLLDSRRWRLFSRYIVAVLCALLPLVVFSHALSIVGAFSADGAFEAMNYVESLVFPLYVVALGLHVYLNHKYYKRPRL